MGKLPRRKSPRFDNRIGYLRVRDMKGSRCAWEGCEATFSHARGLPKGWSWFHMYWSKEQLDIGKIPPEHVYRDSVLCPTHYKELQSCLKSL